MAAYVPADCLVFIEANDLTDVAQGIQGTEAWQALSGPVGATTNLSPNHWLVRLARWTGIGSRDAVVLARSQVAVVITGMEANDNTLIVKPLAVLIIETHTTQRRMRATMEGHIEEFARRAYGRSTPSRKQVDGVALAEWSSPDGARHLVTAFVDTAVIVGNDESLVLHCVEVRWGKRPSLAGDQQLLDLRKRVDASSALLFGFVSRAGVKPFLRALALSRATSSPDAIIGARMLADIAGNLVEGLAWSSRSVNGAVEERCFLSLAEGVAYRLRNSVVPQDRSATSDLRFVPPETQSISIYHLRDVEGAWHELNAVVASHTDALGSVFARSGLQNLLGSYGISDAETFVHSVGANIETIRLEDRSASVLVAEALDRPSLRKLAQQRLGPAPKTESVGDAELMLSGSDNWATSFADNYFLTGPAEAVRRCLQARAQSQSLDSVEAFRRAKSLIDVSLPITTLTFTNDQQAAISFVELFSRHERSAFSTNAAAVNEASRALPYAVNVTMLKENGFEWTSRSAFGLLGSLLVTFAPENSR